MKDTERDQILLAALNAAVDGIIVICDHAVIRLFSQGAEKLFGYSADEVIGKNVNVLMPVPHQQAHDGYVSRFLETRRAHVIGKGRRVNGLNKAGEVFPIHLSISNLQTSKGVMFVGIARDLREESDLSVKLSAQRLKSFRLQRKLNQVHGSSTLRELVSSIAHQINQPLAAITSYADTGKRLLAGTQTKNDSLVQILNKISAQSLRAGAVVRQLREISQIGELPREVRRIDELIGELMQIVDAEAEGFQCSIAWIIADDLPKVLANSSQIQHVILLLLQNSLESLVTHAQRQKGVEVVARKSAAFVEFEIIDHGAGIDDARLDTLYHPFTTTKTGKMGLGLSICQTIINGHGGRLWQKTNPTGGSRFLFTLPEYSQPEGSQ